MQCEEAHFFRPINAVSFVYNHRDERVIHFLTILQTTKSFENEENSSHTNALSHHSDKIDGSK